MTYLKEWHVRGTKICQLPDYLFLFTQLTVLELSKNTFGDLPPEIGEEETLLTRTFLTGLMFWIRPPSSERAARYYIHRPMMS